MLKPLRMTGVMIEGKIVWQVNSRGWRGGAGVELAKEGELVVFLTVGAAGSWRPGREMVWAIRRTSAHA